MHHDPRSAASPDPAYRVVASWAILLDAASAAAHGRLPEWPKGAVCKTVGSAYVGSNPTPATTCGNGPLAADTRQAGPFLLLTPCIVVRHRESTRCGVHGRIADGGHAIRTVGAHRRLSADGHGRAA